MFMPHTQKPIVEMDYDQLEREFIICENTIPTPFISATLNTDPSNMVKKCKADGTINPYWKTAIKKEQTRRLRLVITYKGRVKGNGVKEGLDVEDYTPQCLSGKEHLPHSKSVLTDSATHTKRYVMVEWFEEIKDRPSRYVLEGNELDKKLVSKYINYPTAKPLQAGQQRKVNVMTPLFESLIEVNMNGKRIKVRHPQIHLG
jgi:hypothetical protein